MNWIFFQILLILAFLCLIYSMFLSVLKEPVFFHIERTLLVKIFFTCYSDFDRTTICF